MQASVREAVDSLANSRGRSTRHILVGLGLTAGAVLASAAIARIYAPATDNPEVYSDYEELEEPSSKPPRAVFSLIWPPLFMALTLSGLRIWNAPKSAARTQALTLWGVVQGLNAVWMALGPRRLGGQLTTAVASLGTAGAYVWRARRVDPPAANMVAPYVGWIGFANVLSEELWRRNATAATLH
ncbi:tryptophan-rich sensory protein [Phenylobacterium hankyongense]|uniref:Tryptophan-rich sensory protein n=1 Tax=Phenylobacterium hankyongense TaxID=1813876 RepID=A0A328AZP1_9CAUL|nr:TspO/MBR family protein [Phenylobacterium hankyongense]RAK59146.1 tryptophan-rich sensory protein [Phenylobacterium hankyongense]